MDNNFDRKVQLMNSLNTQKDIYYFGIVSFVLELQLDFYSNICVHLTCSYMLMFNTLNLMNLLPKRENLRKIYLLETLQTSVIDVLIYYRSQG